MGFSYFNFACDRFVENINPKFYNTALHLFKGFQVSESRIRWPFF